MADWKKVLTEAQIDTDTAFGSASDALVPSQLAVKTYVDAQVDTADTLSELTDVSLTGVADGHILVYDNPEYTTVALSGDATMASTGAMTIAADAVTYAKMQNVSATDRILGRDSSGAGVVEEISPSSLRAMINVEDAADVTDKANVSSALASLTENDTLNIGDSGNDSTVNIRGNLTVSGTTTTVSTANLEVQDAFIRLATPDSAHSSDANGHTAAQSASEGGGIALQSTYGTTDTHFARVFWSGTGKQSGWSVADSSTGGSASTAYTITTTSYSNDGNKPTTDLNGIGSFHFDTNDDSLYVRIS